jgi:uncharacterized protein (DUF433 family)
MGKAIITCSPDILGGTPVFAGTRVPVQTLLDYLEGGESIDDFLEGFPTVKREQIIVKVLLDECIDRRFAALIVGHEVKTVPQAGWAAVKNGDLLTLAVRHFDVFVTVDRNLSFQQHLPRFSIAVIVLRAPTNRLADLRELTKKLLDAIPAAKAGEVTWVGP